MLLVADLGLVRSSYKFDPHLVCLSCRSYPYLRALVVHSNALRHMFPTTRAFPLLRYCTVARRTVKRSQAKSTLRARSTLSRSSLPTRVTAIPYSHATAIEFDQLTAIMCAYSHLARFLHRHYLSRSKKRVTVGVGSRHHQRWPSSLDKSRPEYALNHAPSPHTYPIQLVDDFGAALFQVTCAVLTRRPSSQGLVAAASRFAHAAG